MCLPMKFLILGLSLVVSTSAFGQLLKVTTITAVSTNLVFVTNSVTIPNGQAARVTAIKPNIAGRGQQAKVLKDGQRWSVERGDVIQGPATFEIWSEQWDGVQPNVHPMNCDSCEPLALVTLERWTVIKAPVPR